MLLAKKPLVVAALQSPHLLNIWSQSSEWRLRYELMGDHDGLDEAKDLQVERVEKSQYQKVKAVLVCSPAHLDYAEQNFPKARKFWVVHTGYFLGVFPPEHIHRVDGILTLSRKVQALQSDDKPKLALKDNFVITPFYETNCIWRWNPNTLWTIRSRPSTRHPATKERFEKVLSGIIDKGLAVKHFGQDAPDGYINYQDKIKLATTCSGYISALPEDAGFGLAEHEAFSWGVPIVGSRWGDIDEDMSTEYPTLVGSEEEMIDVAVQLTKDSDLASRASKVGLEYISTKRSPESMGAMIKNFIYSL